MAGPPGPNHPARGQQLTPAKTTHKGEVAATCLFITLPSPHPPVSRKDSQLCQQPLPALPLLPPVGFWGLTGREGSWSFQGQSLEHC